MPTIEPSATAAPEIEDGLYVATWLDAEEKYVEADAFGKNHKLEIHLEVDLGNGQTEKLDPLVNWAWSERATLYKFALGFGGVVDLGSAFDTDDMKGKQAQVLIKTDAEKSAWPKVVDVIAIKKGKAAPANEETPFDTAAPALDALAAAKALADFVEGAKAIGYTAKEIGDLATGQFGKPLKDLTLEERDQLGTSMGV